MTRALLRPGGVEGVLQGVFGGTGGDQDSGKEESDTGTKSLSVAKVLGTVPGGMDAEVSHSVSAARERTSVDHRKLCGSTTRRSTTVSLFHV